MNVSSALDILKHPQSGDGSDIKEAMQCAISALEKQIPKKVEVIDKNYGYYSCKVCGAGITYRTHKYCYRCGQALDWSDTE